MGNDAPGADAERQPGSWRTYRTKAIAGAVVVTVLAVVAVLFLRGSGSDDSGGDASAEAERFLDAWAAGDLDAAARLTDDPESAASLLESVQDNMRPESVAFDLTGEPGDAEGDGLPAGAVGVPFTATFTLQGIGEWSYGSTAVLVPDPDGGPDGDDGWTVAWGSDLVHPELAEGQTLVLSVDGPERAPVLAADGSQLAGPATVWDISVWPERLTDPEAAWEALEALDVGIDTGALADRVEAAEPDQAVAVVSLRDAAFREHEEELRAVPGLQSTETTRSLALAARPLVGSIDDAGTGVSGLQERYDEQLAGSPSAAVVIADRESGDAVDTLYTQEGGEPGTPVRTTIDPAVQRAAEEALGAVDRTGALVAVQPSTGHVLAAADWPQDDFNRSFLGQLAPGSTFKVITSAALLEGGTAPDDVLGCPEEVVVNGQRFENQGGFSLGADTTLHDAFTASCNTAFIGNRDLIDPGTLPETAQAFGIGGEWSVGAASFDGAVPAPENDNALAAALIGQGRVQASPLVMASVAATVAEGTFHQPVLVPDAVTEPYEAPAALGDETVAALRTMMRDTVTEGSASALRDVPGEPAAKTGTAEFDADGDGETSTNAWMIGYLGEGDLAFAVVLEDGGSGGSDAGPVAAAFLNAL
ncbi:penicillin-binding transpeptidase domain-containing protein [Streptomyces sp. RFCAC02]|uniref:penicillin-binding transpeptidase domain-containing protein n=1 Tax=Streptomyces sp. RFCAC02 TaxID=2499143 RepID=UPI001020C40D|nr:penicillin-binding transpeptidase domain-containing protein [Streptomyces sp. RFCAC02]